VNCKQRKPKKKIKKEGKLDFEEVKVKK